MSDPEDLWDDPSLARVRDFARARSVSPWATLGVVLMRALATVPPDITLPPLVGGRGSLNMFLAVVGASGLGKGTSVSAALDAVQFPTEVPYKPLGSGEGLVKAYAHRELIDDEHGKNWQTVFDEYAVIFDVPEIDQMGALGGRSGSTLMSQLRSAYSGEQLGATYANDEKAVVLPRHSYRLTMITGVQPARSATLLGDADGGTPQRFIWMPAADPGAELDPQPAPAPLIVQPVQWKPGQQEMGVPAEAVRRIREGRYKALTGATDPLDGHALFSRLKVAAAFAVLKARPSITVEDWRNAGYVMRKSTEQRQFCTDILKQIREDEAAERGRARAHADQAREEMGPVLHAKRIARIGDLVIKHTREAVDEGGTGLTWTELYKKLASRDRPHLEEAVRALRDADRIARTGQGDGAVYEPAWPAPVAA